MLNFTVGPVQSDEATHQIGAEDVPYFRTPEFSTLMKENEKLILEFSHAPEGAKAVFLTGSGTAAMEAAVMNVLNKNDKALVVNGGSFGQRFAELCKIHDIPHTEIKLPFGHGLSAEEMTAYDNQGYSALLVNVDETSSGVLYDTSMLGEFCKRNHMLFICDCISSFLADPFDMEACGADVMLTGSQKALACPPGISIVVLSERALARISQNETKVMYLDLKSALTNMQRGQTPFTPAVGILRQINRRLKDIKLNGGAEKEIEKCAGLAEYFRSRIKNYPFEFVSESPANGVTSLRTLTVSAKELFQIMKDQYDIWICPNGGAQAETVFRIGHLGNLQKDDYDRLFEAFDDLMKKGIM